MTFHTKERLDPSLAGHVHESPWVVLLPLVALAIPSLVIGQALIGPMLFSHQTLLGSTVFVLPEHQTLSELSHHYHGAKEMALDAGKTVAFWLAMAGIVTAWLFTARYPSWSAWFVKRFSWLYAIMQRKYGFDDFNQIVLVRGTQDAGHLFYDVGDVKLIDGVCVNGSGRLVRWAAQAARRLQTGYLYHYALAMILGVVVMLAWYVGGF